MRSRNTVRTLSTPKTEGSDKPVKRKTDRRNIRDMRALPETGALFVGETGIEASLSKQMAKNKGYRVAVTKKLLRFCYQNLRKEEQCCVHSLYYPFL